MTITLVKVSRHVTPGRVNAAAADTICRRAHDVDDARYLLEMVGLVAVGGRELLPDDTAVYGIADVGKAPGGKNPDPSSPLAFADHGRRPDGMTTPPGLASLPPVSATPAPPRARKRAARRPARSTAVHTGPVTEVLVGNQKPINHGSPGGYFAHSKRKVPIPPDDSCGCRAAGRAYFDGRKAAS